MREILFRAKDKNGKWVYGAYIPISGRPGVCIIKENDVIRTNHLCAAETVGEYIGYCDKNGKKIFEGDILQSYTSQGKMDKTLIRWGNTYWTEQEVWCDEIIGNIHDNPELFDEHTNA